MAELHQPCSRAQSIIRMWSIIRTRRTATKKVLLKEWEGQRGLHHHLKGPLNLTLAVGVVTLLNLSRGSFVVTIGSIFMVLPKVTSGMYSAHTTCAQPCRGRDGGRSGGRDGGAGGGRGRRREGRREGREEGGRREGWEGEGRREEGEMVVEREAK